MIIRNSVTFEAGKTVYIRITDVTDLTAQTVVQDWTALAASAEVPIDTVDSKYHFSYDYEDDKIYQVDAKDNSSTVNYSAGLIVDRTGGGVARSDEVDVAVAAAYTISSASGFTVPEFIDKILGDLGQPTDGTGFWTRQDIVYAVDYVQREISRMTENILATTATLSPASADTEVTLDSGGNFIRGWSAYRTYGGTTRECPP